MRYQKGAQKKDAAAIRARIMETFNFDQNIILENGAVLLRPLVHEDLVHLLPFALSEPEIWQYSPDSPAGSEKALSTYIEAAIAERENHTGYPFIVFDKASGRYAGCTRFYDINPEHRTALLGYTWYGSEFCGTGLNKNCKLLLLSHAFESLKLERVEFRAHSENARSIAAMKSIGCTVEGILRSHMPHRGAKRRDTIVLSIIRPEWKSIKSNLTKKIDHGSIS